MRKSFLALLVGAFMFVGAEVEAAPATVQNLGGISKEVRALEGRTVHQFGGVSKEFDEVGKQLTETKTGLAKLEKAEQAAKEAVAGCGKGETLADRLRKCVDLMVAARKLKKQVAEQKAAVEGLNKQVAEQKAAVEGLRAKSEEHTKALEDAAVERRQMSGDIEKHMDLHKKQIEDLNPKFQRLREKISGLYLQAEWVFGAVEHKGGAAFALGAGLSMPVAKGDWQAQIEALGSIRKRPLFKGDSIGFTLIGRGLTPMSFLWDRLDWLVVGPNARFHRDGPSFSKKADVGFAGIGMSVGISSERFGLMVDASVGSRATAYGEEGIGWAGSALAQVKF